MAIDKNSIYKIGINLIHILEMNEDDIKVHLPKRNLTFIWSTEEFNHNLSEGIISKIEL